MESTPTTSDDSGRSRPAAPTAEVAMTDDDESFETFESSLPDCPTCGRSVWVVSVSGPLEATASPCGCAVAPGRLERE
ncbi:hypothetical protein [Natrinema sp. SYSU A 869]|uniref:hypothetical protein n=1 Tax=Natrinema sp. SYSU A 869 TaxID=2871694 RepID=UPI001CA43BDB|nr:hypothetical protein [Natrinema sp. SYSU A 869]